MLARLDERPVAALPSEREAHEWLDVVARYRDPRLARSLLEIVVTFVPFVVFWAASYAALSVGWWLSLLLAIPAAGFLLRLFLIQHDCGHLSFFPTRAANDWVGRALGVLTLTPYDVWKRSHAIHHASSGNLDKRGTGDVYTLTVSEFRALSPLKRLGYRLYRHPFVMFGLGPFYVFFLQQRLPFGQMRDGWRPWISAMGTNLAILLASALMIYLIGFQAFVQVHVPIVLMAATTGIWLFYVQHQFEDTVWADTKNWSQQHAALYGSSFYDLPPPLSWFSANIGIHHVHHLYSRIPYYRLPEVLRDNPELTHIRRIGFLEGFKFVRLKLWDEERQKLVSFREAGV